MTDVRDPQSRPAGANAKTPDRRPTLGSKPAFWPTVILASAGFLILFEFLAFQLAHGRDPAVGGASSAAAAKPPRPVLVRRVVETRIVPDGGSDSGTSSTVSSGSASSGSSAAGAAQTAAAAPAPAPAAPAAPVVSSSS
jgi:hypothetical protein